MEVVEEIVSFHLLKKLLCWDRKKMEEVRGGGVGKRNEPEKVEWD